MKKIVFTTDQLPAQLDDAERFARWREMCSELFCEMELSREQDRPFSMRLEYLLAGPAALSRGAGTMSGVARTKAGISMDGSDDFSLSINLGTSSVRLTQGSRELFIKPNETVLFAHFEAWAWQSDAGPTFLTLNLPRSSLTERVANIEDILAVPLDPQNAALCHLWRYVEFLLQPDVHGNAPKIGEKIHEMLADLTVLALGDGREAAEVARLRGLRAARLQEILAAIKGRFTDPTISSEKIGRSLGLSRRYVNDLLFDSGQSFTERVMELRLQEARRMLTGPQGDRIRIGDIALACGFNEVSYFNRSFRRRFGASPTQLRGGGAG